MDELGSDRRGVLQRLLQGGCPLYGVLRTRLGRPGRRGSCNPGSAWQRLSHPPSDGLRPGLGGVCYMVGPELPAPEGAKRSGRICGHRRRTGGHRGPPGLTAALDAHPLHGPGPGRCPGSPCHRIVLDHSARTKGGNDYDTEPVIRCPCEPSELATMVAANRSPHGLRKPAQRHPLHAGHEWVQPGGVDHLPLRGSGASHLGGIPQPVAIHYRGTGGAGPGWGGALFPPQRQSFQLLAGGQVVSQPLHRPQR